MEMPVYFRPIVYNWWEVHMKIPDDHGHANESATQRMQNVNA
jgi:hypothetical protein